VIGNEWLEIGNRILCVVCRKSCTASSNDPPQLSIDPFWFHFMRSENLILLLILLIYRCMCGLGDSFSRNL
jgi:hypothetical protein